MINVPGAFGTSSIETNLEGRILKAHLDGPRNIAHIGADGMRLHSTDKFDVRSTESRASKILDIQFGQWGTIDRHQIKVDINSRGSITSKFRIDFFGEKPEAGRILIDAFRSRGGEIYNPGNRDIINLIWDKNQKGYLLERTIEDREKGTIKREILKNDIVFTQSQLRDMGYSHIPENIIEAQGGMEVVYDINGELVSVTVPSSPPANLEKSIFEDYTIIPYKFTSTFSEEKLRRISESHSLQDRYELRQANGLTFFTDPEKPQLKEGENAVYSFFDEAAQLLRLAKESVEKRGKRFAVTIDPYGGGGHSGLPILENDLTEKVMISDINPRATRLAEANAELNGLDGSVTVQQRDILTDGLPDSDSPGNTLYIANPPFALKVKGASMDQMRDGGPNGLKLTMAYASQAVEKAQPGDVIIGVAYSRIRSDGTVELTEELKKLTEKYGIEPEVVLLKDEKLWRGEKSQTKDQRNPMQITGDILALKAKNLGEISEYHTAANFHNEQGYTQLGYFSYIIRK